MSKTAEFFICEKCDFTCCKKSNWDAHTSTQKHNRLVLANSGKSENDHIILNKCLCGKSYNHASSLCKHKKTCFFINNITNHNKIGNTIGDKEIIYALLKQNNDLQNKIVEILKK